MRFYDLSLSPDEIIYLYVDRNGIVSENYKQHDCVATILIDKPINPNHNIINIAQIEYDQILNFERYTGAKTYINY